MSKGARGRRGFTLIETVVTVGIVATLAAVVVPQVVKQMDTADPTRTLEDLKSIQTAIETFSVNVRPQQPLDLEDLVNRVTPNAAATDANALGAAYSTTEQSAWNGPYLGFSLPDANDPDLVVLETGFGGIITNKLSLYDVGATFGGDTVAIAAANTAEFIAIRIGGLSASAFNTLNDMIDGAGESTVELKRHSGRFRCPREAATTAAADTACTGGAFYLATPIRQ